MSLLLWCGGCLRTGRKPDENEASFQGGRARVVPSRSRQITAATRKGYSLYPLGFTGGRVLSSHIALGSKHLFLDCRATLVLRHSRLGQSRLAAGRPIYFHREIERN